MLEVNAEVPKDFNLEKGERLYKWGTHNVRTADAKWATIVERMVLVHLNIWRTALNIRETNRYFEQELCDASGVVLVCGSPC